MINLDTGMCLGCVRLPASSLFAMQPCVRTMRLKLSGVWMVSANPDLKAGRLLSLSVLFNALSCLTSGSICSLSLRH